MLHIWHHPLDRSEQTQKQETGGNAAHARNKLQEQQMHTQLQQLQQIAYMLSGALRQISPLFVFGAFEF